mgnify:CR=1 FL=1
MSRISNYKHWSNIKLTKAEFTVITSIQPEQSQELFYVATFLILKLEKLLTFDLTSICSFPKKSQNVGLPLSFICRLLKCRGMKTGVISHRNNWGLGEYPGEVPIHCTYRNCICLTGRYNRYIYIVYTIPNRVTCNYLSNRYIKYLIKLWWNKNMWSTRTFYKKNKNKQTSENTEHVDNKRVAYTISNSWQCTHNNLFDLLSESRYLRLSNYQRFTLTLCLWVKLI